jgi:hypothetical protein
VQEFKIKNNPSMHVKCGNHKPFEMWKKRKQNEASQSSLLNLLQTSVFYIFNLSKKIHGIISVFYDTDSLGVLGEKRMTTISRNGSMLFDYPIKAY